MFVRRTKFNLLFQPNRIGKTRRKAKSHRFWFSQHGKVTKMADMRANKVSRRTNILSRVTRMRMIIVSLKANTNMYPSKSFMLKRLA